MNATGQKGNNTIRLAVVGFGKVGKACAESLIESKDLVLAAIVRRLDSLAQVLPDAFSKIPIVSHTAQVQQVEGALLCVPMAQVLDTAHECLQHGIPIIESSVLHGEAFQAHRDAMHRLAMRYEVPAIVGAGWDPGALSFLRSLFALLVPEGNIEIRHRVAASLRHTAMARQVVGVKEALCTEQLAADGTRQRYVYVELAKGLILIGWLPQFGPIRCFSEKRPWCFRSRVLPRLSRRGVASCWSGGVRRGARGINGFCSKPASMNPC